LDSTRFSSLVFAFGGSVFDEDQNQFLLNSSEVSSVISYLHDLINNGCAVPIFDRQSALTAFSQGKLLFMIDSSLNIPTMNNLVENTADFNWAIAPLPSNSEYPVQNIFGASLSIPSSSPERELAAWLFIKYLSSAQTQANWGAEASYLPIRQGAETFLIDYFIESPNYQVAFNLLPFGITEPSLPGYDFIRQEIELALNAIFAEEEEEGEEINIQEILDSLNATANQIFLIHLER
jgi:multiple sugar transport system substrate-binding protein/sn-glycerol 3-phosphate transport system substrate-binding protein